MIFSFSTAVAVAQIDSDAARTEARDILSGRGFHPSRAPKPFRGILRQIGEWLQPVTEPIRSLLDAIGDRITDWPIAFWVVPAAVVVLATVAVTTQLIRRKSAVLGSGRMSGKLVTGEELDPAKLEREATKAEGEGDFERAVRLRFLAGLLRLDDAGLLTFRPSITTFEVGALVRSATFTQLAADFDAIVYGGREAFEPDASTARANWPRVLQEVGRP